MIAVSGIESTCLNLHNKILPVEQLLFLKELLAIFGESINAYHRYLLADKIYQFAQPLKLHNGNALQLLKENKALLPANLQEDIQLLITHYTEWSQKWEQLDAEKKHKPNDVFVFANDITFPKQAAQHLEAYYKKITRPPASPHEK